MAISYFNQRSYVSRMMENGAKGYILKNSTEDEIKQAITDVLSGKEHLQTLPLTCGLPLLWYNANLPGG